MAQSCAALTRCWLHVVSRRALSWRCRNLDRQRQGARRVVVATSDDDHHVASCIAHRLAISCSVCSGTMPTARPPNASIASRRERLFFAAAFLLNVSGAAETSTYIMPRTKTYCLHTTCHQHGALRMIRRAGVGRECSPYHTEKPRAAECTNTRQIQRAIPSSRSWISCWISWRLPNPPCCGVVSGVPTTRQIQLVSVSSEILDQLGGLAHL